MIRYEIEIIASELLSTNDIYNEIYKSMYIQMHQYLTEANSKVSHIHSLSHPAFCTVYNQNKHRNKLINKQKMVKI